MANRSDFFNAKLPRGLKRMLAMSETYGWIKDSHERGRLKRQFISAHANHVGFKLKRHSTENRDASDSE
jgi:predicted methyltransferase